MLDEEILEINGWFIDCESPLEISNDKGDFASGEAAKILIDSFMDEYEVLQVGVINKSNNENPTYSTEDSAGMDLRAMLDEPIELKPFERVVVPTGLYLELPSGYEAQIRPRSGLAAKYGITVLNTPGTIDADYKGEIKVILINLSQEPFTIESGDRICQMVVSSYEKVEIVNVSSLRDSDRGEGGFGHTGLK